MATSGGQPGNQNNKRGTLFRDQLTKIIRQEETTMEEKKRSLHRAAYKLLALAAIGEEWAVKELANRLDGKAIQGVELTGKEGDAVNFLNPANLRNMNPEEITTLRTLLQKAAAGDVGE